MAEQKAEPGIGEKRRPRLWMAFAVLAAVILATWLIVGESLWRTPDKGNDSSDALVQPSTPPSPDPQARRATPDNSGRDATGNAVDRTEADLARRPTETP